MIRKPHQCPYCVCGLNPPMRINPYAPFFGLVLLIDELTYGRSRPRIEAAA